MTETTARPAVLHEPDFTFFSRQAYFEDLVARIATTKRGDRVMVVTHDFRPEEPLVAKMIGELIAASTRGVDAHFALDERSFPVMQRVPVSHNAHRIIVSTRDALQQLDKAGISWTVTNKTYHRLINRFSGRAHIKLAIVNDEVYVGGCNLDHTPFIDMMVRWQDRRAADWLFRIMSGVIRTGSTWEALAGQDRELALDSRTTLLLDAGKPRQSVIFERALALIDAAEEWIVLTCQFFPNRITAQRLAAAHRRGVRIGLYYNHPSIHRPGFNALMHAVVLQERAFRPAALFAEQLPKGIPYLHAKLLASEKSAIIGSHNFVLTGVNLGTAELSLLRHDPVFAHHAVAHFRDQLAAYIG